jgi:hypothetical protein
MRNGSRLFRLSLWLASTSLSLSGAMPALAQPAPPPGAAQSGNGGDPPALAGRLSDISGTVSYHAAGADQWSPATQNFPVTSGNAYWTEPQASATIEIGDDVLVMDGGTELDVTTLDQSQFVASTPQGAIFLGLRDLPDGQALTVTTPRGAVQITQPGEYEIVAGDTNNPTSVTVVAGAAHITATGVDLNVTASQTAAITGSDTFQGGVAAIQQDQFLQTQLAKFQPPQQSAPPPPAVAQQVRYMTGGQELSQYGSWSQTQQYGQLWYPNNVGADWVPYRDGHWAYVAPWGWNWVDAEPWGFAPFHYGRWINDGGRWGWMAGAPGVVYGGGYPVYAPALVSFVGIGGDLLAGAAIGFGAGLLAGGGGIGWFPLGYREPFVPWYHVSDGYFRGINRYSGLDVRNISINNYRNITINHYSNSRFATVAPERAFASGARMQGLARPLPQNLLDRGRPINGRLPVTPTANTPGLSRREAAQFHVALPPRGAGTAGRGPEIRPGAFGHERPALRPVGLPGNVRPATAALPAGAWPGVGGGRPGGAPGPAINRPGGPGLRPGGLPALRPSAPGREAPGTARPGIGQPGGGRPGEQRPGAQRPGEQRPGEQRPGEQRPGEQRPGEQRPGVGAPGAGRPGEARPGAGAATGARPGADRPGEARPGEARPGEARPGEARPGDARPGEARPGNAGQGGARPGQTRPGEARPNRAEAARPEGARPAPARPEGARPAASRPAEARAPHAQAARPAPSRAPRPEARPQAPRPAPRPAPHPATRPSGGGRPAPHGGGNEHKK